MQIKGRREDVQKSYKKNSTKKTSEHSNAHNMIKKELKDSIMKKPLSTN